MGRPCDQSLDALSRQSGEEEDWRRLTVEQFFKGYAVDDDIYDRSTPRMGQPEDWRPGQAVDFKAGR
jgi:hypothetical protein